MTKGVTGQSVTKGVTNEAPTSNVRPRTTDLDKPTESYKLTTMEKLFYRPAKDLLKGQTNFVSLPGRACYE